MKINYHDHINLKSYSDKCSFKYKKQLLNTQFNTPRHAMKSKDIRTEYNIIFQPVNNYL